MTDPATIISKLQQRLRQPLPGLDAQMAMAPEIRGRMPHIPDNVKKSATLLLLYPENGQWYIPFMRRTQDGRVHGGQVCFPGGRRDPEDPSYVFTALRETEEELGIPKKDVTILGNLTELYIPPSNFMVYPQVGYVPQKPTFIPDPKEVADVIEVDMTQFLDENIRDMHRVDVFGGNFIEAPGYTVNDRHLIWGGTAMMIAEFAQILSELWDE